MTTLWLLLALALADVPGQGSYSGFDRLRADPGAPLPKPQQPTSGPTAVLTLASPFTARATVFVDELPIGELRPRQTGRIEGVAAGVYRVRWVLPGGQQRDMLLSTEPAP